MPADPSSNFRPQVTLSPNLLLISRMKKLILFSILLILSVHSNISAQQFLSTDTLQLNYSKPTEYEIAGVTITGAGTLDNSVLLSISGLYVGDKIKIPGDAISTAIKNLWKEKYFEDVSIVATKIQGTSIFLEIRVKERPRLAKTYLRGMKRGEHNDLKEKLGIHIGAIVTDNLLVNSKNTALKFFVDKGFLNTTVDIRLEKDSVLTNSVNLFLTVKKGSKVRIQEIDFYGNNSLSDGKLRRAMKETKRKRWYAIFTSHTFLQNEFDGDKEKLIQLYNTKGYRDARIVKDSLYKIDEKYVGLVIKVDEGRKYYFRNITWVGNSKYPSKDLDKVLNIKKGDVFNQALLESRLTMSQNGSDVSSLYMDDGYLFFQITPVEVMVEGDSIDMEIRIYEGKQATINKVTVKGNIKTNDHVIMREIRTRPGQLFRRSDIIRSQRDLSMLGYFDTEKMGVNPIPHPENGTVDIEYVLEEKSSDQFEMSAGFGQNRVVGSLGVSFGNFSTRNFFKGPWQPLPAGDGQRLSIRGQSNGAYYQSVNMSFTEPWLGGRKPNSLSVTPYFNHITNGRSKNDPLLGKLDIWGLSVGLGQRLKRPDDFFTLQQEINYQYYVLKNYRSVFTFSDGFSNNLNYKITLARNSQDDIIYPKSGSQLSLSGQFTIPYSLTFNRNLDYSDLPDNKKYKWIEYYKFKFASAWYTRLVDKLVLYNRLGFGWLGSYNQKTGLTPFERFYLGGSGLTGYNPLDGREIISLRGYDDGDVFNFKTPGSNPGAASIVKYVTEIRYPLSLNPNATIYGLVFAEAGNSWGSIRDFNPFNVKRSAGVGLRFFLPMFGMLGFDYGWRFDDVPFKSGMQKSQFHFTIGQNLGEL